MVRPAGMIVLTAIQKQKLTSWARAATTPQHLARRLAQQERMSRTTGQRWRARFVTAGCDGLWSAGVFHPNTLTYTSIDASRGITQPASSWSGWTSSATPAVVLAQGSAIRDPKGNPVLTQQANPDANGMARSATISPTAANRSATSSCKPSSPPTERPKPDRFDLVSDRLLATSPEWFAEFTFIEFFRSDHAAALP